MRAHESLLSSALRFIFTLVIGAAALNEEGRHP